MTASAEVEAPEFTVTPQLDPEGATGPVIKVTWSVNMAAQAELMHVAKGRLCILFVFVKDNKEIERQVFPYVDGHAGRYLRFHQSGTITVHACIVWHDRGEDPTKRLTVVTPSSKRIDVMVSGSLPTNPDDNSIGKAQLKLDDYFYPPFNRYALAAVFEVEVPANHFASPKENWWITRQLAKLWVSDSVRPLRDPCDTRSRAIKGLLISPVMLLLGVFVLLLIVLSTIIKVAAVIFLQLILGMYDVNYRSIWDFSEPPIAVWEGVNESRWVVKRTKTDESSRQRSRPRSEITWLINPPVILVVLLILWISTKLSPIGAVAVRYALIVIVLAAAATAFGHYRRRQPSRETIVHNREQIQYQRLQSELAFELTPPDPGFGSRARFHLWARTGLDELKNRVCKPFEVK